MSTCSICYDTITPTTGSCTLGCSHIYHLKCIATWIITHPNCPCCRKDVNEYETISTLLNEDTITYNSDHTLEYMDEEDWIRTPTGRWVQNGVPILQLPPQIQRIPYTLNPTIESLAVIRIQATIRGFLIRKLNSRIR